MVGSIAKEVLDGALTGMPQLGWMELGAPEDPFHT